MDIEYYAEKWFFYGICDLYFSFHTEELVFDYYSSFFSIMAFEKHLKAFLIYHKKKELAGLEKEQLRAQVLSIARSYSHNFIKMITDINSLCECEEFSKLLQRDYDGYRGEELIKILRDGYMETRYPILGSVALSFPVAQPGIYHDPLSSSGIHKFIFNACEFLIINLSESLNLEKILKNVTCQYQHLESFCRFKNVYLRGKWT